MSAIRRFQTAIALLVVVLLSSPALAACCAWAGEPMACCEKTEGERLVASCCMSSSPAPQQQPPAVAKLSKLEPGAPAPLAGQLVIAVASVGSPACVDQVTGPPGANPLYLRLAVIRR
jgi:hypothetical protein